MSIFPWALGVSNTVDWNMEWNSGNSCSWHFQSATYYVSRALISPWRLYHKAGFNYENLIIVNCDFFYSSQTLDSQTYFINSPPLRAICADAII